jgi:putative lipoprotein
MDSISRADPEPARRVPAAVQLAQPLRTANTVAMTFRALFLLLGLALFAGCQSDEVPPELEDPARVTGTLTYLQRVALPPDSVVHIALFVLSHPGAPASLVNEETFVPQSQVPIPFEMWYRRDTIDANRIYALQARIDVGDKTWFKNNELVPVITNGALRGVQLVLDMSSS